MRRLVLFTFLLLIAPVAESSAQSSDLAVNETTISKTRLFDRTANYWKFVGDVELESGDAKIYADDVEYWVNEDRVLATGNVVYNQGNNRVAADRAIFNVKTRLGTFY